MKPEKEEIWIIKKQQQENIKGYKIESEILNIYIMTDRINSLFHISLVIPAITINNQQMNLLNQYNEQQTFFITILSEILEGVLDQTDDNQYDHSIFSAHSIPQIKIQDYLSRIKKKTKCSNDCLIMALIYIDKYSQVDNQFRLSRYSIHRLILVCILIATKIHDDFYYDNNTFAIAGGVPLKQLNELELKFFENMEFKVFILPDEFNEYKSKIIQASS